MTQISSEPKEKEKESHKHPSTVKRVKSVIALMRTVSSSGACKASGLCYRAHVRTIKILERHSSLNDAFRDGSPPLYTPTVMEASYQ